MFYSVLFSTKFLKGGADMNALELRGTRLIIHLPAELDHHCTEEIRKAVDSTIQEEPVEELELDLLLLRLL